MTEFITDMAQLLGVIVLTCSACSVVALMVYCTAKTVNKAVWVVVDSYGGVKVLNEFRQWMKDNK